MWHPDKNSGDKEAEMKFQLLTEAKEILCNPEKRQVYDKWRNSGLQISYKNFVGMKDSVVSRLGIKVLIFALYDVTKVGHNLIEINSIASNNQCTGPILRQRDECCQKSEVPETFRHIPTPKTVVRRKAELLSISGECFRQMQFGFPSN